MSGHTYLYWTRWIWQTRQKSRSYNLLHCIIALNYLIKCKNWEYLNDVLIKNWFNRVFCSFPPEYSEAAWQRRCEECFIYRLFKTTRWECKKGEQCQTLHQIYFEIKARFLNEILENLAHYSFKLSDVPDCSSCDRVDRKRVTFSQRRGKF